MFLSREYGKEEIIYLSEARRNSFQEGSGMMRRYTFILPWNPVSYYSGPRNAAALSDFVRHCCLCLAVLVLASANLNSVGLQGRKPMTW